MQMCGRKEVEDVEKLGRDAEFEVVMMKKKGSRKKKIRRKKGGGGEGQPKRERGQTE